MWGLSRDWSSKKIHCRPGYSWSESTCVCGRCTLGRKRQQLLLFSALFSRGGIWIWNKNPMERADWWAARCVAQWQSWTDFDSGWQSLSQRKSWLYAPLWRHFADFGTAAKRCERWSPASEIRKISRTCSLSGLWWSAATSWGFGSQGWAVSNPRAHLCECGRNIGKNWAVDGCRHPRRCWATLKSTSDPNRRFGSSRNSTSTSLPSRCWFGLPQPWSSGDDALWRWGSEDPFSHSDWCWSYRGSLCARRAQYWLTSAGQRSFAEYASTFTGSWKHTRCCWTRRGNNSCCRPCRWYWTWCGSSWGSHCCGGLFRWFT